MPIKRWVHMDAFDAFMNGTLRHKRSVTGELSCVLCPQYYYVGRASGNIEAMSNRETPECHDESIRLDDNDLTDQGKSQS